MELYRILISAQTASFRYPNLITSNQLSIKSVPYSTIAGLVASATGDVTLIDFLFSYTFRYNSTYLEMETTHRFEKKGKSIYLKTPKAPAPYRREILFDCYLTLYLEDEKIASMFRTPIFQLLLGRSGDLARVLEVKKISVQETKEISLNGTIVPLNQYMASGEVYALPSYFNTDNLIRKGQKVQPFLISDGLGKFKYPPNNTTERFSLKNWVFTTGENAIETEKNGYIDKELKNTILLRKLC